MCVAVIYHLLIIIYHLFIIIYHLSFDSYFGLYIQTGTDQCYLLRVIVLGEGDANWHTLLYLYEVAGGVVHWNHAIGIAGCG